MFIYYNQFVELLIEIKNDECHYFTIFLFNIVFCYFLLKHFKQIYKFIFLIGVNLLLLLKKKNN